MKNDPKTFVLNLIKATNLDISRDREKLLDDFIQSAKCQEAVNSILENQNKIMTDWKYINRIYDIKNQHIPLPNATCGKPYHARIDLLSLKLQDVVITGFSGLNEIGLQYDQHDQTIQGVPTQSGDIRIELTFLIKYGTELQEPHVKHLSLIINPDPRTLWKDIPSDSSAPFWKADDVTVCQEFGDKTIVVSSKRGRSHKNVGSFRDDDFAFRQLDSGWSVIAVSDGAGSYSLSRKGSELACQSVIQFFKNEIDTEQITNLENKLLAYGSDSDEQTLSDAEILSKKTLYQATLFVHNTIREHAEKTFQEKPDLFNNPKAKNLTDYYHCTLIFTLFKKFWFGYVILSFSVGDCPIVVMHDNKTKASILNWLDVGEFGGGTRFITQPSIFHSVEQPMASRFNLKVVADFNFLFLMTDGIYDPKFEVEANLEKNDYWIRFLEDLNGNNEENNRVDFEESHENIAEQLSSWMDFWSPGNHDDRTLAIVV